MSTRDGCNVVCPYCGYEHGDAWEWCPSDIPKEEPCDGCGKTFKCWAEYDVQYIAEEMTQR